MQQAMENYKDSKLILINICSTDVQYLIIKSNKTKKKKKQQN